MKIIADLHMHTTASTHAYSTLSEMVHAASQKGLYAVAITDHGHLMPGAPGRWYFQNMNCVPHMLEDVLVLRGEETNILDFKGTTDLTEEDLTNLDWVVASFHNACVEKVDPTCEEVTNAWLNIAKDPRVNVIGHSGTERFGYDYETVLPEFARSGKLVEINEGTFRVRKKSISNCTTILKLCKKHCVPVVVDSDSHFSTQVGDFTNCLQLLDELDFPEELVVNSSVERLQDYLRQYTDVFSDPTI